MHRVDAFGNSAGVYWKLAEGIGSLLEWRKGVRQKKIKTRWKIIGVAEKLIGSRDGLVKDILFARRFAEGIGKLAGNAKGDRRKEDQRTCRKIARGCRSMRDDRQ
ncbi:hypothetical protein BHE74_00052334 [Ensete ventricosum]|nr:hypothetical protein BHE74_00052334 [Ensete ventricosum]